MTFLLRDGISLRGNGLEILLLVATIITSIQALLRTPLQRSTQWRKVLYWVNCLGLLPLCLSALLMGLLIYGTPAVGTFAAPSGTRISLKQHIGLLGCQVHSYRIQGAIEHHLNHRGNTVSCWPAFAESKPIDSWRWNVDETQLILTIEETEYIFEIAPNASTPN
ncbi:MAG: hypothetical protein F6K42_24235 [Leptolyngbya sp. SIO1D8]|nr:hypothetical protein [Leptolyngbya sp. SIO1D8]